MDVPSKTCFDSWSELLTAIPGASFVQNWEREINEPSSSLRALCEATLTAIYADAEEITIASRGHAVREWLVRDHGFNRATEKMFRGNSGTPELSLGEVMEREVAELKRYRTEKQFYLLTTWAARKAEERTLARTWVGHVSGAINEYLHVDHDARHAALVAAGSDLRKILTLLKRVEPLVEREFGFRRFESIETNLRKAVDRVDQLRPERDQRNKAEHVFIRRAAKISQRFSRDSKIKPVVVDNLQSIGAIRHQFDIRTIHRICKELTKADEKRAESAMA